MKAINNFSDVKESGDFMKLIPGGYVARILKAEDNAEKEYLTISFDIAEGDFAGHYKELSEKFDFWGGKFVRSYKEKALGMFKRFLIDVDASNGTELVDTVEKGLNEQQLVGKLVGIILGEEKYDKNNGEVGVRLIVTSTKTVDEIRKGDFRIPELKDRTSKLEPSPVAGFTPDPNIDLPF